QPALRCSLPQDRNSLALFNDLAKVRAGTSDGHVRNPLRDARDGGHQFVAPVHILGGPVPQLLEPLGILGGKSRGAYSHQNGARGTPSSGEQQRSCSQRPEDDGLFPVLHHSSSSCWF